MKHSPSRRVLAVLGGAISLAIIAGAGALAYRSHLETQANPLSDDASLDAETAEEEDAALMALDRALRHEFFMIPTWYNDSYWVAYYDQYDHPEIPPYALGYLDFWWYDEEAAQQLRASGALR